MKPITAQDFLSVVQPALEQGDADHLVGVVLTRWLPLQVCGLLSHPSLDTRRTAGMVLGFVGDRSVLGHLTRALRDDDEQVHSFAEDALWSIWFRLGKPKAINDFTAGLDELDNESYDAAIECFEHALDIDPQFAEAHHQCALAHYLAGRWIESKISAKQAIALLPTHFGAMSTVGHCHAHLHEFHEAIDFYRRTLAIHPHLADVETTMHRLQEMQDTTHDSLESALTPWDIDLSPAAQRFPHH